jgi:hypothetical protein
VNSRYQRDGYLGRKTRYNRKWRDIERYSGRKIRYSRKSMNIPVERSNIREDKEIFRR